MVLTNGARPTTEQTREISSVKRDYYGLSSYANYFLRPQDAKILAKGNGKKLHEVYRDVQSDPRIYAALTQRFGAAIGREIVVEAASDRRIDKKAADEVRLQIKNLGRRSTERSNKAAVYSFGGFENATLTFLDARFIGYSVVEIDWAVEGDRVIARQLWSRESSRFTFDIADGGWELRLITPESPLNGIALPPKKFLLTCVNSHDDSPYGDGLANKLFWLSWLKRQIQKWWAIFCDKHGSPTLKGKYSSPNQRDRLLEVMANISQQAGVALPEGVDLELLQAASTGTDVYSAFCGYCDTQAVEAILLQNLTTNITGGSYAASETHLSIREELVDADIALLSDGPYADLSKWITEFNYPDAEPPLIYRPRVKVADEARSRRDTALVALVQKPLSKSYLATHYDAQFASPEEIESDRIEAEKFAPKEAEPEENAETPFVFSESLDFATLDNPDIQLLLALLKTHYSDRITNIRDVELDSNDDIIGVFEDKVSDRLTKYFQFKIGDFSIESTLLNSSQVENFAEDTLEFKAATKERKCIKGRSCGSSCINASKVCKTDLPERAIPATKKLKQKLATTPKPGSVAEVSIDQLNLDPDRFQYKLIHGATGSSGSLSGVKKFDKNLAGIVQVWHDPADGKDYIVNGHNRANLAKQLGESEITVRYLDVKNAAEARAVGALTNIAEGRGNALDAAKFFNDTGLNKADLDAKGIPLREKIATDGLALSSLDSSLFRQVIDGDIPVERATIIGGSGLDHVQQRSLVDLVDSQEKRKRKITNETIRELADGVKASTQKTDTQFDLFGASQVVVDNAVERASLQATMKQRLSRDKKLFGIVSKSRAAEDLKSAGNIIDIAGSAKISQDAASTLAVFDQLKNVSGPVSSALNKAADRLVAGENSKKVTDDLYKQIKDELPKLVGSKAKTSQTQPKTIEDEPVISPGQASLFSEEQ